MDLNYLGEFDRVYAYARVSSVEQADKRQSIEVQESRLLSVKPKPSCLYRDVVSGDESDRPDYIKLIEQVKTDAGKGLRVLVVITEQSRLSREGSDAVTDLIEMFDILEVCLYALDGGRQTVKEPQDWLMRSQEATFNKYFLLQLRRNLRSVKAQRRAEGKPINPSPPYGYKWSREKYLRDEEQWDLARADVLMYLPPPFGKGFSLNQCEIECKKRGRKISAHGFREWMKNPALRGHLVYSKGGNNRQEQKRGIFGKNKEKIWHYNAHEALIIDTLSSKETEILLTGDRP